MTLMDDLKFQIVVSSMKEVVTYEGLLYMGWSGAAFLKRHLSCSIYKLTPPSHQPCDVSTIIPILQRRKLGLRDLK